MLDITTIKNETIGILQTSAGGLFDFEKMPDHIKYDQEDDGRAKLNSNNEIIILKQYEEPALELILSAIDNGIINAFKTSGTLDDFSDVEYNNLAKNDLLIYDGIDWINTSVSGINLSGNNVSSHKIPLNYVPKSDGIGGWAKTNIYEDVNGLIKIKYGTSINEFSIDGTLGGNSDLALPTEKAVKTYVDSNAPHKLLSTRHTDTTVADVSRGDIITGQGVSATWTRYAISVPGANLMNVFGVVNGDVEPGYKAIFDNTNPTTIGISDSASAGTAIIAAHRDHQHASPATWPATAHDLFSTIHGDTTGAASPVDGDIIIGNATPKWSKLARSIPGYASIINVPGILYGELRPSYKTILDSVTIATDRHEPTGFTAAGVAATTLSFVDNTRIFTITGNHEIYIQGIKSTKSTASITLSDVTGTHWIYYNSAGTLSETTSVPGFGDGNVFIATVYYNTTPGFDKGLLGGERHGITMDWKTHNLLHNTVGVLYAVDSTGALTGAFTNTTFSIGAGAIYDEDNKILITAQTTCDVLYKNGAADFEWDLNQTAYYKLNAGNLRYNNGNALADVGANQYMAMWIFATNSIVKPIVALMGQRTDVNIADARANNKYESLALGNLPFQEMKLLYRVILRNAAPNYYIETQDLRTISNLPAGTFIATAHGALSGLEWGVSGHNNIVFNVNNNANGRVGVGVIDPLYLFHLHAADGVSDNTYVAYISNDESTADRNNGLWINAGSSASDYNIRCAAKGGAALWNVTGAGAVTFNTYGLGIIHSSAAGLLTSSAIVAADLGLLGTAGVHAKFGALGVGLVDSLLSETASDVVIGSTKRFGLGAGKGGMTFTDAATDTITFDDCNVGIGTVAPTEKLVVAGNVVLGYDTAGTYLVGKTFATPASASNVPSSMLYGLYNGTTVTTFAGMSVSSVRNPGNTANDYTTQFYYHQGGIADGIAMTIDKIGYIGIGAVTPYTKFEVLHADGTVGTTPPITSSINLTNLTQVANTWSAILFRSYDGMGNVPVTAAIGAKYTARNVGSDTSLATSLCFLTGDNLTYPLAERMRITDVGNVGIGTTPATVDGVVSKLTIAGSTNLLTITGAATAVKDLTWFDNTSGEAWIWSHRLHSAGNNFEAWYHNGTNWNASPNLALTPTGNVGIGTTAPLVDVGGSTGDFDSTSLGLHIKATSGYNARLILEGGSAMSDGLRNSANSIIFCNTSIGGDNEMFIIGQDNGYSETGDFYMRPINADGSIKSYNYYMSATSAVSRYTTKTVDAVGYSLQIYHDRNGNILSNADVIGCIDFIGYVDATPSPVIETIGRIESRWYSPNGGSESMRFLTNGTLAMYIEDHGGGVYVTNELVTAAHLVAPTIYVDHISEKTNTHGIVFDHNLSSTNKNISAGNVNLDDDTATSFTPGRSHGMLCIHCQTSCTSAIIAYDVDGSVSIAITAQSGTTFAVTTGALSGTTGGDGTFNVSVHTDGKIYFENRTGGT